MMNDDDDLKEGLKKSMSEPAKPKHGIMISVRPVTAYLSKRKEEYDQPHGNETK